ncbi:MAG: hypothetical protein HC859_00485 [Bacteroidia bacterium]|nr:hypothetical protein [Bacteroidia bacterium]
MNLEKACTRILSQLGDLIQQISDGDYVKPSIALSQSTVGQHLRHTLEFFICLEQGCVSGTINYDKRAHDRVIEEDRMLALSAIERIKEFVTATLPGKSLKLEVGYDLTHEEFVTIETNFLRELTYNIEHAVHHMAIMKIGVREVALYITMDKDFGVAASTIRHKETNISHSH